MKYLVITDIHSNMEALRAVLHASRRAMWEEILCCGDIVGYGPNPNEVIHKLMEYEGHITCVRGNHDREAVVPSGGRDFNSNAKYAINWTFRNLDGDCMAWLYKLPTGPIEIDSNTQIAHGSHEDEDKYVFSRRDVRSWPTKEVTFIGHTHYPSTFWNEQHNRSLVNPGSVGQPRDGDPRAAYAIYDSETLKVSFHRVKYDVQKTQAKMVEAHLPPYLIERLSTGN